MTEPEHSDGFSNCGVAADVQGGAAGSINAVVRRNTWSYTSDVGPIAIPAPALWLHKVIGERGERSTVSCASSGLACFGAICLSTMAIGPSCSACGAASAFGPNRSGRQLAD